MSTSFEATCSAVLGPALEARGFERVVLRECIAPELLWRNGREWLGLSFDARECLLEIELGRLRWFRDVLSRVVVTGRLREVAGDELGAALAANDVDASLRLLVRDLDALRERCTEERAPLGSPASTARADRPRRRALALLGDEVSEAELRELVRDLRGRRWSGP